MKRLKILSIIMFSSLMLLPFLFFNWKSNYISEIDNRKLAEFPKLDKLSGDKAKEIFNYFNDRIGFREEIIQSYGVLNNELFNILVHPAYIYGQDGYVYFGMHQKTYDDHTKKFTQSLKNVKDYVESRGGKFYVLINPEKTSVYTEHLPKGVHYNRNWMNQVEKDLSEYGINFIDNTEELKMRSKSEQVYNRQYDAGHWNDLGAFYGVNSVLNIIGKEFPKVKPHIKEDFEITTETKKYLPTSKFEVNEAVPDFSLKNSYEDLTGKYDAEIKRDKQQNHFSYIKGRDSELPKALVFQGSYLNGREKYLAGRFSEYISIHNYQNIFNIDYYYNIFQPDIVIFEVAEYTINNTYFTLEKMENMKLNPVFQNDSVYVQTAGSIKYSFEKGNSTDTIVISGLPEDTEYVYFRKDNKVYDVHYEDGRYFFSVKSGDIVITGDEEIIFKKKNDEKYYGNKAKEEKIENEK